MQLDLQTLNTLSAIQFMHLKYLADMELNRVRLLSHVTATASKDMPKEQIVSVIEATFDENSTLSKH